VHPDAGPRWGVEFDWFAVDAVGQVGVFSSAGYGPVPSAVFPRTDDLYAWSERSPRAALVVRGACSEQPDRSGDYSDWVSMAERGFYGYDWRVWDGPYVRLTVPSRPVRLSELPSDVRDLASLVPLDCAFAVMPAVDLSALGVRVSPMLD